MPLKKLNELRLMKLTSISRFFTTNAPLTGRPDAKKICDMLADDYIIITGDLNGVSENSDDISTMG